MRSFQQWKKDFAEAFDELISQDILGEKKKDAMESKTMGNDVSNEYSEPVKNTPDNVTDVISEELEKETLGKNPEGITHENPEEMPEKISDEFPEGIIEEISEEIVEIIPEEVLEEFSAKILEDMPEETAEEYSQEDDLLGFFETTVDEELEEIIRAVQEKRRQDPNRKSAIGKASREELIALINSKSAQMTEQRSYDLQHLRREIADLEAEVVQLTPEEIEAQIKEQEERKEILQSFLKRSQERVKKQQERSEKETKQDPEKNLSAEEIIEYRFHLPIEDPDTEEE